MKLLLPFTLLLCLSGPLAAQTIEPVTEQVERIDTVLNGEEAKDPVKMDEPRIERDSDIYQYAEVEQPPQFPGGDSAMIAYLKNSIVYPVIAKDSAQQGRVFVQFVVERDGSVTNCVVLRHPRSPALAAEALRVVSTSPQWIPGKIKGEPVRTRVILPVQFVLPR